MLLNFHTDTTSWKALAGNKSLPSATNLPVPEMTNLNMFYIEQNPGDIMWVPAGLFHSVRNMTNTVALTYAILTPDAFLHPDRPGIGHMKFKGKIQRKFI
jgi:hypothetical protein